MTRHHTCAVGMAIARPCRRFAACRAQERPAVGPERPFQLAPRVERDAAERLARHRHAADRRFRRSP